VDLLTYPFGWINTSDWDLDLPSNTALQSAYLHVLWYSDTGLGASNINIDYWNGNNWMNCAGPFEENSTISDTICDISSLSTNQLNNIMVRLRGEDIDGFPNAFIFIDYVYLEANYTVGVPYFEVELVIPNPSITTNIVQNNMFIVNATVYCRGGNCGDVNATLRYNSTFQNPDTPINTTEGDKPLNVYPDLSMKACPTNPLGVNEFCNITWVVNATGDINTAWKIGVLFNTTQSGIEKNHTYNSTIAIIPCVVDITVSWNKIIFPDLLPNSNDNIAPGNSNNLYNITVNPGSCTLDLWIKGTDLENITIGTKIGAGNLSWNNFNSSSTSKNMTKEFILINNSVSPFNNITTYYWLDVIPIYAGRYNGNITIMGNKTS
jgi:hypothetical protein